MDLINLDTLSKYIENRKVIRSSQHGCMKVKSCPTNATAFHDDVTGMKNEGRAVDVAYVNFSNACNTVSHNTLVGKLIKYGLGKWKVS